MQRIIAVVSYPKCGRTWLRALIGKALSLHLGLPEADILATEQMTTRAGLPLTTFTHDGYEMLARKSWRELPTDKQVYRNMKVILLGRDIKDTLVSAYFQASRRIRVFDGTLSEFLRSDRYGVLKLLHFYQGWQAATALPQALLFIRYEDLHRDTAGTLKSVLDFLGASDIPAAVIQESISACSFDNLRRLEASNAGSQGILSPGSAQDPESYKVRKGKVGGYVDYLSGEDIAYLDEMLARHGCDLAKGMPPS